MSYDIRTTPIAYTIHGFSLQHDPAKGFGEEIMALLGRVWPILKAHNLPTDGLNRVVYDNAGKGCSVFAGLVLGGADGSTPEVLKAADLAGLERKAIRLSRYAVWKHTGPYSGIAATGAAMTKALAAAGHTTAWPMVEVYGHWTSDERKLETETLVELR